MRVAHVAPLLCLFPLCILTSSHALNVLFAVICMSSSTCSKVMAQPGAATSRTARREAGKAASASRSACWCTCCRARKVTNWCKFAALASMPASGGACEAMRRISFSEPRVRIACTCSR
jgi:hypothetical protein